MYNRQRSRLTTLKEHASPPVVSEPVIFRPTHTTDQNMRRFKQPPPNNADLQLHNLAGTLHRVTFDFHDSQSLPKKLPIHHRSGPGKKSAIPAVGSLHDSGLGYDPSGTGEEEEDGTQSRESRSAHNKAQKGATFLPGDRVIFAESPTAPGIPVVYRTPEERAANPDRLNLDRRKLTVCPILEGEDQLRLLNYQHNAIMQIQHLATLRRLIFLDLYDNQIDQIAGLSSLKSLRVLMLGKNKIKKIENLDALVKLDVLDLHGNQISIIENLNHLIELRVLNLAGNQITSVDNLTGIDALAELNLRRNKIRTVIDVDTLPNLQRLFLSFNEISSFEDVQCLGDSTSLSEICLDGNPLAQDPSYRQIVLRNMQQLKQLDMRRVTEEERRLALVTARKEEEKRRELNKVAILKERRRLAINNAKRHWETMQGSLMSRTGKMVRAPELYASRLGSLPPGSADVFSGPFTQDDDTELVSVTSSDMRAVSRPGSAHSNLTDVSQEGSRDPDPARASQRHADSKSSTKETVIFGPSSGDAVENHMMAELEEDKLIIYGHVALAAFDRNWGPQVAASVTTIFFELVNFNEICKHLHKVRSRFPNTQNLIFRNTSMHSLQQINALTVVRSLEELTIALDGNPVTKFTLWRLYIVHRLSHFNLKKINGVEVSTADIINAERLFGPLTRMVTTHLPQYRLPSVGGDTRKRPVASLGEEGKARKGDKSHVEHPGRAALTYSVSDVSMIKQAVEIKREFTKSYLSELTKEAISTDRKRAELLRVWPAMFFNLVQSAITQLTDPNTYTKNALDAVECS